MFDEKGAIMIPDDKTGPRHVRIVQFAGLLKEYLERDLSERPFLMHIAAYEKELKRAAKEAGITKRVWPYLFRHGRASAMYGKIPDLLFKRHFGWSPSSNTPNKVYVHLSADQMDNAICGLYGNRPAPETKQTQHHEPTNTDFMYG
jgi:integrase